jgi:hypothetical protein
MAPDLVMYVRDRLGNECRGVCSLPVNLLSDYQRAIPNDMMQPRGKRDARYANEWIRSSLVTTE